MKVDQKLEPPARVVMLRELNHRAKNILQMISSVLALEMNRTQSEEGRHALGRASQRLQMMSHVHSMLYLTGGDTERVEMEPYLLGLCDAVLSGFLSDKQNVRCDVVCGAFNWPVETAGQIGMIVAEALINSCKHAFPCSAEDRIGIGLHEGKDATFELEISDNGNGFDAAGARNGVGSALVRSFALNLKGKLDVTSKLDEGTRVTLLFPRASVPGATLPDGPTFELDIAVPGSSHSLRE